jgi:hypothetical protein
MKAIIFFVLFTMLTIPSVLGQIKIGDNPQNIDPASVLELESSSKVLVITRVSSLEMEAITPQRGGIVYNTDTECINYYDGTQWINLCDAVNFTITNDPIINNRATIAITQTESGYNLEIAKNGILGDNIVDGGIGPDDIQDNSITQDKLAAESVGSSEIRQNAVGSDEIRDGSIAPTDMANFIPGQVLTTDENGIVGWSDSSNLQGAVSDAITISGNGTNEDPIRLSNATQNEIDAKEVLLNKDPNIELGNSDILYPTQNAVRTYVNNRINDVVVSGDGDSINEQNLKFEVTNGNLEITDIDGTLSVPLTDLNNQILSIAANRLAITNGNDVDLNPYLDNTDEQILEINGNQLSITGLNGGNTINLPAAVAEIDGIVGNEILNATDGTLVRSGGGTAANPYTLDVAPNAIGTAELANNAVTNAKLANNSVQSVNIVNGTIATVDIAPAAAAPANTQILTTSTAGMVNWIDLPTVTTLNNGFIFVGDINNEATPVFITKDATLNNLGELTISEDAIDLDKLNPMGATTTGQLLKWNQTTLAWELGTDIGGTLPVGQVLIGNAAGEATPQTLTGDATIDNAGVVTISADAVENSMIDPNVAGNGLTQNAASGALDIIPGTVENQILKWNNTTTTWEIGTNDAEVKGTAAGSIFFAAPTTFTPIENNAQLFWDNVNEIGVLAFS